MSRSTSEEKKNPVITLKAQAEKFDFSKLRADKGNAGANSGEAMYLDFDRMDFVIKGKVVDTILIKALINRNKEEFDKIWEKYCEDLKVSNDEETDRYKEEVEKFYDLGKELTHLLPKAGDKNKSYRPFVKEVFKEIFKYAEAEVPSDSILEELITNCNQAGYVGALYDADRPLFHVTKAHELTFSSSHTTHINCYDSDRVAIIVKERISTSTFAKPNEELCKLDSSLEFILESQDGKDDVTYEDGKLSITVPRNLRDYKIDGRSLFDIIKEYFYKLCEKLGFKFEVEIAHDLGDPLEVNSCVKDPNVDLSNKLGTPGVND